MPDFPLGRFGWWIAFLGAADPGPETSDVARVVDVATSTGAGWVCVRAGAGGLNDSSLCPPGGEINLRYLRALRDAGLKVVVWIFSYVRTWRTEVEAYRRLVATGLVDAVIINAEFDWETRAASYQEAATFIGALRAALPPGFHVGHAPPDYLGGRGGNRPNVRDCWEAFDELCDSIHPQCYAFEHADRGHVATIREVVALYRARGLADKVCPVLCSYRPKTRGYDKNGKPLPTPPMADEAGVVSRDVVAGIACSEEISSPAFSIYTVDALNFVDRRVGDAVLAALRERHAASVPPATPPAPVPAPEEPAAGPDPDVVLEAAGRAGIEAIADALPHATASSGSFLDDGGEDSLFPEGKK